MTDFPGGESGGRVHGVRLSNATGIRKNGPLDFNGLDSNHHALLEVERGGGGGGGGYTPSLFFLLSFLSVILTIWTPGTC